MFLTIGRTFKEAIQNFFRNGWLSIATVSILFLSLFIISVFFVVTLAANNILKDVQGRVNISIYLNPDVDDQTAMDIKANLQSFSEVRSVDYVSKDQALADFKRNNADEPVILQSLDQIGGNPLLASLVVKANNPDQYQMIADYASKAYFSNKISRINYGKNKDVINKLNGVISMVRRIGIGLGLFFGFISLLITFNAIRITIYAHKTEVEIMRLVGASNMFIRLPFIFEGILYGILASILSMAILFVALKFMVPYISIAVPSSNLAASYWDNFGLLFGGQIILGSFLGVAGSLIAMRRYLKV